jgi:RHS repeat-associated protein
MQHGELIMAGPIRKSRYNYRRDEGSGLLRWPLRNFKKESYHWTAFDPVALRLPGMLKNDGSNFFAYCAYDPVNCVDPSGGMTGGGLAECIRWRSRMRNNSSPRESDFEAAGAQGAAFAMMSWGVAGTLPENTVNTTADDILMQGESVEAPDEQKKLEIMQWVAEYTGLWPLVSIFRKWATSDGRELLWKIAVSGEDTYPNPKEGGRLFKKGDKLILATGADKSPEFQKIALFHEAAEAIIQWIKTGTVTQSPGIAAAADNHATAMAITAYFYPQTQLVTGRKVSQRIVGPFIRFTNAFFVPLAW